MTSIGYAIGMTAGIVAIMIAIYLEWVVRRPCNAKYIYAYLFLGVGLVFVSAQSVFTPDIAFLRVIGFGVILILEIYGFIHLYHQIHTPATSQNPTYRFE